MSYVRISFQKYLCYLRVSFSISQHCEIKSDILVVNHTGETAISPSSASWPHKNAVFIIRITDWLYWVIAGERASPLPASHCCDFLLHCLLGLHIASWPAKSYAFAHIKCLTVTLIKISIVCSTLRQNTLRQHDIIVLYRFVTYEVLAIALYNI